MTTTSHDFLTLEEAAQALRCSVKTLRRRINHGFPAIKLGGQWRVPREAIIRAVLAALGGEAVPMIPGISIVLTRPR